MSNTNEQNDEIRSLLKSGDFTIVYWDNGEPILYRGKWDKDEEFERDDYETMSKSEVEITWWDKGYCPQIVVLLAEALGGNVDSI